MSGRKKRVYRVLRTACLLLRCLMWGWLPEVAAAARAGAVRTGPPVVWCSGGLALAGYRALLGSPPRPRAPPPTPPATHPLPCPKARDWDAKPSEQGTKGGPGSGMSGLTLGGGTRDRPPRAGEASPAAESCAPTGSGPTRIGRGRKSQMSG